MLKSVQTIVLTKHVQVDHCGVRHISPSPTWAEPQMVQYFAEEVVQEYIIMSLLHIKSMYKLTSCEQLYAQNFIWSGDVMIIWYMPDDVMIYA